MFCWILWRAFFCIVFFLVLFCFNLVASFGFNVLISLKIRCRSAMHFCHVSDVPNFISDVSSSTYIPLVLLQFVDGTPPPSISAENCCHTHLFLGFYAFEIFFFTHSMLHSFPALVWWLIPGHLCLLCDLMHVFEKLWASGPSSFIVVWSCLSFCTFDLSTTFFTNILT